ncbi:MAG: TPM domain-containing protein [Flavobacteriales bacterium]|nr:TPM domain-containing protein [Flavobacteriales bacterium]
MKTLYKSLFLTLLTVFSLGLFAELDEKGIPMKPQPARLVNIIQPEANPFSPGQIEQMEADLSAFAQSTSTQITLVIVNDLQGYDKASYATEIGHSWGVGQKGFDNGLVVLLKPKETATDNRGDVFIAVGYGLEGVIPDAISKRIVEVEMIPQFKKGDYYTGIQNSLTVLKGLALKEFTAQQYVQKTKKARKGRFGLLPFIILIGAFFFLLNRRRSNYYSPGHNLPFWAAMLAASSMSRGSGSSFSDFSSGGGGFGGFGGGGFGGGGAGGSW